MSASDDDTPLPREVEQDELEELQEQALQELRDRGVL